VRNLKLLVQFDGTDFAGWQRQDDQRTVQGVLEEALARMLREPTKATASSRTDAGVHALALPVGVRTGADLPLKAFVFGLDSLLPDDVRVLSAEEVPEGFNARFSTLGKTYRYRIQGGRVLLPLERRYAWHVPLPLDLDAIREGARALVGEHDFTSFRSVQCDAASPVRCVTRLDVVEERPGIVAIEIRANGFLRNMVRIVAGTLVQVGLGRRPPAWVAEVLAARDRRVGGMTAPPRGLFLVEVEYPADGVTGWNMRPAVI
jgi:tRNA pseudouridine38-40 synthase